MIHHLKIAALLAFIIICAACEKEASLTENIEPEETFTLTCWPPPVPGDTTYLEVMAESILIDWGDGTQDSCSGKDVCIFKHFYHVPDKEYTVSAGGKKITSLKGWPLRRELPIEYLNNHWTSIDVSKLPYLTVLECKEGALITLDVSRNPKLKVLNVYNHRLDSLDVSKNHELIELDCSCNFITHIDLSNNTELQSLICSGNHWMFRLDVRFNTKLTSLECASCDLIQLDMSHNHAKLRSVDVLSNFLSGDELNKIFEHLPATTEPASIRIGLCPSLFACNKAIARNKGWEVVMW